MAELSRIIICGAGTLGGNLAENLAWIGIGRFTVIDMDRVEKKNLANQPYLSLDIGQPKVKALSACLYRAAGAEVTALHKELTSGNVESLLAGSDLVIDTFDNEESRKIVTLFCRQENIPCLHAGLSNDGYGEVIWNDHYRVPGGGDEENACEKPRNRSLSLLVVSVTTEVILAYRDGKEKKNYTITLKDLQISPLYPG